MFLNIFFEYMPEGNFRYFSLAHILSIVIGLAIILTLCFLLRKVDHKKITIILSVVWAMEISMELAYWIWEGVVGGGIHVQDTLPLYYCSLFYMVLPFAIWSKNLRIKQGALSYIATFNLIAGLMGLIINTNLNNYPVWSFVGTRSLAYHFLMIFTSILIWTTRYYKPNIYHSISFALPLAIVFTPALIVDLVYNADYFYLNGGWGTPFTILSNALPQPIYIMVLYLLIIMFTNLVFYTPTITRTIKNKRLAYINSDEKTMKQIKNIISQSNKDFE